MKNYVIFFLVSILPLHGQFEDGFIKVYPGMWANSVVEMPDTTYILDARIRTNGNIDRGIKLHRLNRMGDILDTFSLNIHSWPFPGRRGSITVLADCTVVSFVRDDIFNAPDKAYLLKWQIYPFVDTLAIKQIYPDSGNARWEGFQTNKIITLNDGNILVCGILFQPTPFTLQGYIAKITPNLEIIWEAVLEEPDNLFRTIDDIIPHNDGTFFISGTNRVRGGNGHKREFIAHIDSLGNIIWEHVFPLNIQPAANWFIEGGTPYIALAQDSNVVVMYSRVLDCGPNGVWCWRDGWWKGDARFVKFDWNGNILIDKLIGSPDFKWVGASNLEPVQNGGFVFGGVISAPSWNTFVLRVDEQGDSIWWREPYFENGRRSGGDVIMIQNIIPTIDNGFFGVGSALVPTLRDLPTDPAQFVMAFRLDSNGCYGPNHCHNTWFSVEEILSENEEIGLKVYPNPAVNEVNIELARAPGNYMAIMRDMQGREVRRMPMQETAADTKHLLLPIQGLPSGMYTIEVIGETRHVMKVRVE